MRLLHYRPDVPNFGDDLNVELWPALAPQLFSGPDAGDGASAGGEAFVGIGTIVGIDPGESRRLHVFSSGIGYTTTERWSGCAVDYHCVRGPVSARVLGLDPRTALTDGGVLAPLAAHLRPKDADRHGRVLVVPHYETIAFAGWAQAVAAAGFELVDPRGAPAEVISRLAGACLVLTESLHGAILADAFDVPWRAFAVSRNFSTAKWADWTSSLGLEIDVDLVPPPDVVQLFRFGRRAEPFGTSLKLDPETAFREFRTRVTSSARAPLVKVQAKRALEIMPLARRVFGFDEGRTAQALTRLACRDPYLSDPARRESLRDEMLTRLAALSARESANSVAVL